MEIRPILSALSRNKTGAILIAAQVALTFAIVVNAAYVIRDRLATAARPTGIDDENRVLTVRFAMTSTQNLDVLQQRDLAALRALPDVESAAIANQVPLGQSGWSGGFSITRTSASSDTNAGMQFDGGDLLRTYGVRVLEGRYFHAEEFMTIDLAKTRDNAPVALITEDFAHKLWPDDRSVIGHTLYMGNTPDAPSVTIIGVIGRLQTPWAPIRENNLFTVVFPQRILAPYNDYVVRVKPGTGDAMRQTILDALAKNDPDRVAEDGVRSIADLRKLRYRGENAVAGLLLAVTGFLLLVTACGIVGMVSLWVNLRRKQIGVRRALGATRFDIVRYFVTETLLITGLGVAVGIVTARLLNEALVRNMSLPQLPWEGLATGSMVLLVLGLASVMGPALRASRLSPALATRSV